MLLKFTRCALLILLCTCSLSVAGQSPVYVCAPCHNTCDQLEFNKPGACPTCGMGLIPKASRLITEEFSFTFDSVLYSAEMSKPASGQPSGVIVLVPGHGKTDFVGGGQYYQLRQLFSQLGLSTLVWDKKGCNKSGGTYEHHQTVASSAKEALAAIGEFKRKYGSTLPVGLWGISRAGWICPLMINEDPSIAFWISVSGTDQFDTFRYMLKSNFPIAGRSEAETDTLMKQFDYYYYTLQYGGDSYAQLVAKTSKLFNDPFYQSLGQARISESDFAGAKEYYKSLTDAIDPETGLFIMVPDFVNKLKKVNIPVLAIFGDRDTQVNWRNTEKLYGETIGLNPYKLQTVIFTDCNHNIQKCKTGGLYEDLSSFMWQSCDGYEAAMKSWLIEQGFVK